MPSELQSAACRISATVMPADTAAVADAALNIETFTPDFCRATLIHRATEDGAIGLCGFTTANSSFCSPLDILTRVVTGHMMGFWSNFGKKNSFPGLSCFARPLGWKHLVGNTLPLGDSDENEGPDH